MDSSPAWEMEYTQPVDRAIHELGKQIEPNPARLRYIKTVYRVGYRFTAYRSEIEKTVDKPQRNGNMYYIHSYLQSWNYTNHKNRRFS